MMNITPYRKIYVTLLIVFVIIGIAYYFGFVALFNKIAINKDLVIEQQGKLMKVREQKTYVMLLDKMKAKIDPIKGQIDDLFVNDDNIVGFIEYIEGISSETGNSRSIKITSEDSNTINANIVLRGTYSNLIKFLIAIENGKYIMDVNSLNVRSASNGQLITTLSITGYKK